MFKQVLFSISAMFLHACGSTTKTTIPLTSDEDKLAAIQTLNRTIQHLPNAIVTTSTDIDWPAGTLPWDRYTLPAISPNGLHAAAQLGSPPSIQTLSGNDNTPFDSTIIELHILDPVLGQKTSPLLIEERGLILSPSTNNEYLLVERPLGESGRWIGQIDWDTGKLRWVVSDNFINAFPTTNMNGDIAWSRRHRTEGRFHLVAITSRGKRIIDDQKSDWLLPTFVGLDRLRAYRILDGQLSLVEFDLQARNPMLTSISLPIVNTGGKRELAWQIATTNQTASWHSTHAFYHPVKKRMVIWQPGQPLETIVLVENSVAATPVNDGSWLVATDDRIIRQEIGNDDGVHIRNHLAIPIATTSKQWTHLMLVPQGNRLDVRAINLDK